MKMEQSTIFERNVSPNTNSSLAVTSEDHSFTQPSTKAATETSMSADEHPAYNPVSPNI